MGWRWRRDTDLLPARAYTSPDGKFSAVWDPEGWHLWDGWTLVGVYSTLAAAQDAYKIATTSTNPGGP